MFAFPSGSSTILKYSSRSRLPGSPCGPPAQPPPAKQREWLCTLEATLTWLINGVVPNALFTCAKKTFHQSDVLPSAGLGSAGASFGEVRVDPSHATSTIPGLPATTHASAAETLSAPWST